MLAKRKMKSKDLAEKIGITTANLSILKSTIRYPGIYQRINFNPKEDLYSC